MNQTGVNMNANDSFEVIPSGAALGADIVGLDLTQEIDSAVFEDRKSVV